MKGLATFNGHHEFAAFALRIAPKKTSSDCLAVVSAWHIGVRPLGFGSNQTGNLNFCSMSPPAPSSTRRVRCSTRRGLLASSLTGTSGLSARAPPRALVTRPP